MKNRRQTGTTRTSRRDPDQGVFTVAASGAYRFAVSILVPDDSLVENEGPVRRARGRATRRAKPSPVRLNPADPDIL